MDNWRKGYPPNHFHVLLLIESGFHFEDGRSRLSRYVCEGYHLAQSGWFKICNAEIAQKVEGVVGWMPLPGFERHPNHNI